MVRDTRLLMGMPITVEIVDDARPGLLDEVFGYFEAVDARFSTYKPDSEISALNQGRVALADVSAQMQEVLGLAERTRRETDGYFEIRRSDGRIDPCGIVKGWAIRNAADLIRVPVYGISMSMPAATSRPAARTRTARTGASASAIR